jgi:hypothetical protein
MVAPTRDERIPAVAGAIAPGAASSTRDGPHSPAESPYAYLPRLVRRPERDALGAQVVSGQDELLDAAAIQLDNFIAGRHMDFRLPMAVRDVDGNELQLSAWSLTTQMQRARSVGVGKGPGGD